MSVTNDFEIEGMLLIDACLYILSIELSFICYRRCLLGSQNDTTTDCSFTTADPICTYNYYVAIGQESTATNQIQLVAVEPKSSESPLCLLLNPCYNILVDHVWVVYVMLFVYYRYR